MLHANPELVHLGKVVHEEVDAVLHVVAVLRMGVGQLVAGALEEKVAQEQAAHRVLHAAAHLHEVFEDVARRSLLGTYIDAANSNEQVKAGDNVASMLDEFVQLHLYKKRVIFLINDRLNR